MNLMNRITRRIGRWAAMAVAVAVFGLVDGHDVSAVLRPGWQKKHHRSIEGVSRRLNPNDLVEISTGLQKTLGVRQPNRRLTSQSQLREALIGRKNKPVTFSGTAIHDSRLTDWTIRWHEWNGTPIFITGSGLNRQMTKPVAGASASQIAMGFVVANRDIFRLDDPTRELKVVEESSDTLGKRHVNFEQWYQGIPVWGHNLVVHIEPDGGLYAINARYSPTPQGINLNDATMSADQAVQIVRNHLSSRITIQEFDDEVRRLLSYSGPTAKRYIWMDKETQTPHVVWFVQIRPNFRDQWYYFIDARSGRILQHYNNTQSDGPVTANATDLQGKTQTINVYQVGTTYYMIDASRPIWQKNQPDLLNGPRGAIVTKDARKKDLDRRNPLFHVTSKDNTWTDRVAVSAQVNVGRVFDYYFTTYNRRGIDGYGSTIFDVIHVTEENKPMDNAFWNGAVMAYGDGDRAFTPLASALDVTAHEMTHGVIEHTVGLEYMDQSGALNESFADVFAVMVDREDWLLGEDIVKRSVFPSGALRSMADPHNGGSSPEDPTWQPADMSEFQNLPSDEEHDNGGVHVNSGIPNRACFLIGNTIGKAKTEKIYYHILEARYLNPQSNFIDMRLASIRSAMDLFGDPSAEVDAVKKAFDTVKVVGDTGTPPPPDIPAVQGQEWIAIVGGTPYDHRLYLARPVIQSDQDVVQLTRTQVYTQTGHPIGISRDGTIIVFVDSGNNIRAIRPDGSDETVISNEGIWSSVALSPDGNRLAATTVEQDTTIFIFDLEQPDASKKIHLYSPATEGVKADITLYADALEWDLSGQYLVYDALNSIPLAGGSAMEYWDVNILDVEKETILRLFPPQPEGIQMGNPSFAQNNDAFIVFDYLDEKQKVDEMRVLDLFHSEVSTIDRNTWEGDELNLGFPKYSPNDDQIVFQRIVAGVPTLRKISIVNKDQPAGESELYTTEAQLPTWFAVQEQLPPQAAFTAMPDSGMAPLRVRFTDTSTGSVTGWLWSFGDGQTSTDQNPTHTYTAPGRYTVTLTITGLGGTSTATREILVKAAAPRARFTATPDSGVAPLNVRFTDTSTGSVTKWFWNFGDNQTGTEKSPIHTYTAPGRYTVTLTVTGPGGTSTATQRIVVTKPLLTRLNIRLIQTAGGATIVSKQLSVNAGATLVFAADGIDGKGNTVAITSTWKVSGDIGTITPTGRFTAGKKAGNQGNIVVSAEGLRDSIRVTILAGSLTRLTITPSVVNLKPGQQVTFTAGGVDTFNNVIRGLRVFWHSVGNIGTINKMTGFFKAGTTPGSGYVIAFSAVVTNSAITEGVFGDVRTGVSGSARVVVEQELPAVYALAQNYPNPFNPETTIGYELPEVANVRLIIYDLTGRTICTPVRTYQQPGRYTVVWDGKDEVGRAVASGIYFYRLEAVERGFVETRRMLLLR